MKNKLQLSNLAGIDTLIVVPFFRHLNLVKNQVDSFFHLEDEIKRLNLGILLVDDSPEIPEHTVEIENAVDGLKAKSFKANCIINPKNLGFVGASNIGMMLARELKANCLLLNSDAYISSGTLTEMLLILNSEEKIGFVGPRSNNASIATLPWGYEHGLLSAAESKTLSKEIGKLLPQRQLVPTIPGSVLLIKLKVLERVGFFDQRFSPGYNEENDLIMRANEIGFSAYLCNRGFAYHEKSVSFESSSAIFDDINSKLLEAKHPYYYSVIAKYDRSPGRILEKIASTLVVNKQFPKVLIDLSYLRPDKNGTSELAVKMLKTAFNSEVWNDRFRTTILMSRQAVAYHELSYLARKFEFMEPDLLGDSYFTFRLHLAQTNSTSSWGNAVFNIIYFLDTIATDCYYLKEEQPSLQYHWNFLADYADSIAFQSKFTQRCFYSKFNRHRVSNDFVALHSCNPKEYGPEELSKDEIYSRSSKNGNFKVLILGNHFYHKMVDPITDLISNNFPEISVTSFGYSKKSNSNITRVDPGLLTDLEMELLYVNSDLIVFPSNYEGFGFPILKSLGFNKKVIAFRQQVFEEIVAMIGNAEDMVCLVEDNNELLKVLKMFVRRPDFYSGSSVDSLQVAEGSDPGVSEAKFESFINSRPTELVSNWDWNSTLLTFIDQMEKLLKPEKSSPFATDQKLRMLQEIERLEYAGHIVGSELLQNRVSEIEQSTSWKLTAPLRKISGVIKNQRIT